MRQSPKHCHIMQKKQKRACTRNIFYYQKNFKHVKSIHFHWMHFQLLHISHTFCSSTHKLEPESLQSRDISFCKLFFYLKWIFLQFSKKVATKVKIRQKEMELSCIKVRSDWTLGKVLTESVFGHCNRLSRGLVMASSLSELKEHLDNALSHMV